MGLTFLTGMDARERTSARFDVPGRPHLVIVGADGKVAWIGHPLDFDFNDAVDAAMEKLPTSNDDFTAGDLPRDVKRHAEAATAGKMARAIKGLRKILDDEDAADASLTAAKALMDKINTRAESCFNEIKRLEDARLHFDSDELADEYDWLKELDGYKEKLAELKADWSDTAHRNGKRAGARYHRGLETLRKGDVSKARRDFTYVVDRYEDTAYAELARQKLEATR